MNIVDWLPAKVTHSDRAEATISVLLPQPYWKSVLYPVRDSLKEDRVLMQKKLNGVELPRNPYWLIVHLS